MTSSTMYCPQTRHSLVNHLGGHEVIQRYTAAAALDKPSGEVRSTLFIPSLGLLLGTVAPVMTPNSIEFSFPFSYSKTLYLHKVCMLPDLIAANAELLPRFTAFLHSLIATPASSPAWPQQPSLSMVRIRCLALMLFCLARLPWYATQSRLHATSTCDLLHACLDIIVSLASSDLQPSCRHWTCTGPSRHGIWNMSSSLGR